MNIMFVSLTLNRKKLCTLKNTVSFRIGATLVISKYKPSLFERKIEAAVLLRKHSMFAFLKTKIMRTHLYPYSRYINWEVPNQCLTSVQQKEEIEFLILLYDQRNLSKEAAFDANIDIEKQKIEFIVFFTVFS